MSFNLYKLKPVLNKIMKSIKRLEVTLVSLFILVLFGLALLQVNEAINPTIDEATMQKAQQDQLLKRVKYSDSSLQKIRELTNIEAELSPNTGEHSENPFDDN